MEEESERVEQDAQEEREGMMEKKRKRYLIVCFAASDWMICNGEDDLAQQIGRHYAENLKRDAKADDKGFGAIGAYPVEVYELGPQVTVKLKPYEVESVEPVSAE